MCWKAPGSSPLAVGLQGELVLSLSSALFFHSWLHPGPKQALYTLMWIHQSACLSRVYTSHRWPLLDTLWARGVNATSTDASWKHGTREEGQAVLEVGLGCLGPNSRS